MSTSMPYAAEAARLGPWFHNLRLPDGTQTAPAHFLGDFPAYKWRDIAPALPQDLSGWSCLDIGCNAGFYSFELARRGGEVLGIDCDDRYLAQARWAAEAYGLSERVRFARMQVYDLARLDDSFDLVVFMGVLYHLRYPLLGLDIVAQRCRRLLLFQTMTMPGDEVRMDTDNLRIDQRQELRSPGWPAMAFIEHRLQEDPTNWWAPNRAGAEAMLRSAGLRIERMVTHETWLCAPDPAHASCISTWNRQEFLSAIGRTSAGHIRP